VQIAKAMRAEVTAVCSTRNVEMARSIGATRVIDYTREDFTRGGPRYDLIMDNVGNHSLSDTRRALTSQGVHIPCSGRAGMGWIIAAALTALFVRQQGSPFVASTTGEDLVVLNEFIEAGKITPVIDRSYPLSDAAQAFRYLDDGHAPGKVVITVKHEYA
jgi:NADPH:quinone reductase-like Zn-dependent oxidoreductase